MASSNSNTETIQEIMATYKSLPPRPAIEELEAAISVIKTVNTEEKQKLDQISIQICPQDVSPQLFSVLQEIRQTMVLFQSHEQRKEALHILNVDQTYQTFDELIQKASKCVLGDTQLDKDDDLKYPIGNFQKQPPISDESLLISNKISKVESFKGLVMSSSTKATNLPSGVEESEKLSMMKVAALIETIAKQDGKVLDLQSKLMENIEWLPVSLGKLSNITELNLSDNKIMALPQSITNLTSLTRLDVHSNQLINLPDSFGGLVNLLDLDLHANRLKSLPESFGELNSLQILIAETNDLEELPYTIGSCSSLVVLKLDFNQLKGLPEAIGKLECLEILSLHYNRIRKLPTTMANLTRLKELDASFNELEGIPESLCFATSLEKLIIGKNFADMTTLPRSIGNLENLQVLDISDDQIRFLPESFGLLSKLKIFRADETPLEVPPREITKLGAQVVVEYMADLVAKRNVTPHEIKRKRKGFWSWICMLFSG
ncbi:unnamed protein product [Lactuca saligna]|uniref:Uncharacterized protein n=1 Tax=Lactuca saligna TaxID=75948 RepID=A0AA36EC26_LACSI|nr:unnamed protein product [Lactuca saligna]